MYVLVVHTVISSAKTQFRSRKQGDAAAPEEVYEKKRGREGAFQTEEEMTQVDRYVIFTHRSCASSTLNVISKRTRRVKKEERRKEKRRDEHEQKLISRVNPGMGNKYEKEKLMKDLRGDKRVVTGERTETDTKSLTNSSTFFRNLQEVPLSLVDTRTHPLIHIASRSTERTFNCTGGQNNRGRANEGKWQQESKPLQIIVTVIVFISECWLIIAILELV